MRKRAAGVREIREHRLTVGRQGDRCRVGTSDAYGPRVTNELIRQALHPYPESLHIAAKVGATRDEQGGWPPARRPEDLTELDGIGLGSTPTD